MQCKGVKPGNVIIVRTIFDFFLIFDLSQQSRKKTSGGKLGLESGSKILDHKNVLLLL